MIFAREISDGLTSLVKQIDAATAKHADCSMGSFVVFCSDDESLENRLKELADKEQLKHIVLAIDNPAGPRGYKLAKDADVTVVLYNKHTVKANHAFRKGELKEGDIARIVADLAKILPN